MGPDNLVGCGDHACVIAPPKGGMGTNGGCCCNERALQRAVRSYRIRWAEERAKLAGLVEAARKVVEAERSKLNHGRGSAALVALAAELAKLEGGS